MGWNAEAIARLKDSPHFGYHVGDPNAAEAVALAAIALLGAGHPDDARNHLQWLASAQHSSDGSVSPYSDLAWPGWPTPLAIIAAVCASQTAESAFPTSAATEAATVTKPVGLDIAMAKQWLLAAEGKTMERSSEFGHDSMLVGWPWVLGTHSWQEPTAWSVLALKSLGLSDHPRTREGVRMLIDRQLPEGGCNYGNTYVLGQKLWAHVEPTGLTMLALANEHTDDLRLAYSLQFLTANLSAETTPISLSYGLLGLAAHDKAPAESAAWLEAAYRRTIEREPAALPIALLTLAAQGEDCLLMKIAQSKTQIVVG